MIITLLLIALALLTGKFFAVRRERDDYKFGASVNAITSRAVAKDNVALRERLARTERSARHLVDLLFYAEAKSFDALMDRTTVAPTLPGETGKLLEMPRLTREDVLKKYPRAPKKRAARKKKRA